jgi:hypothetical protein
MYPVKLICTTCKVMKKRLPAIPIFADSKPEMIVAFLFVNSKIVLIDKMLFLLKLVTVFVIASIAGVMKQIFDRSTIGFGESNLTSSGNAQLLP